MRLSDVTLRGTRAEQPSFLVAPVGALYFVTDENVTERNAGTSWQTFSGPTPITTSGAVVDEALTRFNGASGQSIQSSLITLTDAGVLGFPDNVRQTFNPGANNPGLNFGSFAGDPSTPANGDVWYNSVSNELKTRINGATVVLTAATPVGAQIIRVAITEAELEALNTSPKDIGIAAPGADKIIVPIHCFLEINLVTAYSTSPTYSIVYDTSTTNLLSTTLSITLTATLVKKADSAGPGNIAWTNYTTFDPRNKIIRLRASANPGTPGTGVATAVAVVTYSIYQTT